MRASRTFSHTPDCSVNWQVYRTEEALFLYRPSRFRTVFNAWFRTALIASLFIFILFVIKIARDGFEVDDLFALFFVAGPFMALLILALIEAPKYLVRIDSAHLVFTTWYPGYASVNKIARPEKVDLSRSVSDNWTFDGLPKSANFPAKSPEVVWLRKVMEEFAPNPLPVGEGAERESAKAVRSVLKTMEYHGEPLVRVPHPSEESAGDAPSSTVGIFVRCFSCNTELPKENVWFEEAAGQCPRCRKIFQIGDLKNRMPPKRCRLAFREGTTGLSLHQRPRHCNLFTAHLVAMVLYVFFVYSVISMREGYWIPIPLNWEILQIASGFLLFLAVFVFMTIRTYHVHRFVEFGSNTVQFRTRWLFFERHRSVSRNAVGSFLTNFWTETFGGVYIPYSKNGKRRTFFMLTTEAERLYLVSTINRWLWRNPPHPLPEKEGTLFHPDTSISSLGEDEREWQMFCPHCHWRYSAEELNVEHRNSAICCQNCQQTFALSEIRRFVPEPIPAVAETDWYSLPEVPGLRSEQTHETLTIEYAPPPPTLWQRHKYVAVPILCIVFVVGIFALLMFLPAGNGCCGGNGLAAIMPMMMMMLLLLLMYFPMAIPMFYGLLQLYDASRSFDASWSFRIDQHRFVIHRHYAGESETVAYHLRDIDQLCRNECSDMFPSPLLGRFPSLLCNEGLGGIELVLRDGTAVALPSPPRRNTHRHDHEWNCRLVNVVNRWLAGAVRLSPENFIPRFAVSLSGR